MTPEGWERKADHCDAQSEQLAAEGRFHEAIAQSVRAERFREMAEGMRALTGEKPAPNIRHEMQVQAHTEGQRKAGRPSLSKHAFPRALEAAGLTVAEWARGNRHLRPGEALERSQVRSWFARKKRDQRPIPRRWAKAIEADYGIPATDASWPKGIKD